MKEIEPNRSAASWLAELAKGRYGEYALSVLTALLGVCLLYTSDYAGVNILYWPQVYCGTRLPLYVR